MSEVTVNIRRAEAADVGALCDLLAELFQQEAEFAANRQLQSTGLSKIIEDESIGIILVAESDTGIVGMVNLLFTISTALGGKVALLEDMVVDPAFRGQGLGSILLDSAVELCRKQDCKRIALLTDDDNIAAQRFYERKGFRRSSMVPLRKILD